MAGTAGAGIYIFEEGRFRPFGEKEGLSDNRVEALAPAPGGVWVGTLNGLNRVTFRLIDGGGAVAERLMIDTLYYVGRAGGTVRA